VMIGYGRVVRQYGIGIENLDEVWCAGGGGGGGEESAPPTPSLLLRHCTDTV